MIADENFHAELIDVTFVGIDLVVIGDYGIGEFHVALQQGADGTLEIVAGLSGHGQHFTPESGDGVIEILKNVGTVHGLEDLWDLAGKINVG
jgi:hypothetical protein